MNTAELLQIIRDKLIEYSDVTANDALMLNHMGSIYRHIYNYYSRSQDNQFGEDYPLSVEAGVMEYKLPRNLWNKRVQSVHAPLPVNSPNVYADVHKINRNDSYLHEIYTGSTLIPSSYQIYGQTLKLAEKPQSSYELRLFITPLLVPLGITQGTILSLVGDTLTLDTDLCSDFADLASNSRGKNILSISDGITGEVKHIFEFNNVVDNVITLADPTLRTSIRTKDLSTLTTDTSDVYMDDVVTAGYSTGVSIFSEAIDTLLEVYTTRSVKASIKEENDLTKDVYKDLMDELKSDKVGRPSVDSIKRINRVPAYASRARR